MRKKKVLTHKSELKEHMYFWHTFLKNACFSLRDKITIEDIKFMINITWTSHVIRFTKTIFQNFAIILRPLNDSFRVHLAPNCLLFVKLLWNSSNAVSLQVDRFIDINCATHVPNLLVKNNYTSLLIDIKTKSSLMYLTTTIVCLFFGMIMNKVLLRWLSGTFIWS